MIDRTYVVVSGAALGVVHRRFGRHWCRAVTVFDDQVDRHLALETADVAVAEVVAQLVHLSTAHHVTIIYHIPV